MCSFSCLVRFWAFYGFVLFCDIAYSRLIRRIMNEKENWYSCNRPAKIIDTFFITSLKTSNPIFILTSL